MTYNGQREYDEMFYITNHHENANQNYNEISSHPSENEYHYKDKSNKCWQGFVQRKTLYYTLLMGI